MIDFNIDENEDDTAEVLCLEHGKIYDCSYFDDDMNGCSLYSLIDSLNNIF